MDTKQLLSAKEAADMMGISIPTMYSYLASRSMRAKLGAFKLAGKRGTRHQWRINAAKLEAFLQGNVQRARVKDTDTGATIESSQK